MDFSGAKDAGKRIWISTGHIRNGVLQISECRQADTLPDSGRELDRCLGALKGFISSEENAIFGLDFPFGLPQQLVPERKWESFVTAFSHRYPDADSFQKDCLAKAGGRELKRRTDEDRQTPFSPYNLRMYRQTFYGIRDILSPLVKEGVISVLPMQPLSSRKAWVIEICPASTIKDEGLPTSYKGSAGGTKRRARETILGVLESRGDLTIDSAKLRSIILDDGGRFIPDLSPGELEHRNSRTGIIGAKDWFCVQDNG